MDNTKQIERIYRHSSDYTNQIHYITTGLHLIMCMDFLTEILSTKYPISSRNEGSMDRPHACI